MHHGVISAGIENRVLYIDRQGNFCHFDSELLEIRLVYAIKCNGFELEWPYSHQIFILRLSRLLFKIMVVIYLDLQGHLAVSIENSKKRHSTMLLYTDLGRPRSVKRLNSLLLKWPCSAIFCAFPGTFKTSCQRDIKDKYLAKHLWNCSQLTATRHHWWLVNIGSGNDLVPSGN